MGSFGYQWACIVAGVEAHPLAEHVKKAKKNLTTDADCTFRKQSGIHSYWEQYRYFSSFKLFPRVGEYQGQGIERYTLIVYLLLSNLQFQAILLDKN